METSEPSVAPNDDAILQCVSMTDFRSEYAPYTIDGDDDDDGVDAIVSLRGCRPAKGREATG